MPDGSVLNHRLTFDDARRDPGTMFMGSHFNFDGFAKYARLPTDGNHLVWVRMFHENVSHDPEDAFRGLDDVISKVATTTGQ